MEPASLTQKDLGARVGVSRQALNALETGKHKPSLDLTFRLAAVFGCEAEDLFTNPTAREKRAERFPDRVSCWP
jgi:putative transcriptional regulator